MNPGPGPIGGSGPGASWLNRIYALIKSMTILTGPGYRIRRYSNGIVIDFQTLAGGKGGSSSPLSFYYLKSVQDDYVTASVTPGGADNVHIGKPAKLRTSLANSTIFGTVHTYTYQNSPYTSPNGVITTDSNNKIRLDDDGSGSTTTNPQIQCVVPVWLVNDLIIAYACPAWAASDATNISLMMVADWRLWAYLPPS